MGFLRKLKKAGGKLLQAAVKVAPTVIGGVGGGPIGAVVASKLRTMGENRSRQKLAAKIGATSIGPRLTVKKLTSGTNKGMVGDPRKDQAPPAKTLLAMRDPAVRELLTKENLKGVKSRVVVGAARSRGAKSKWSGLDADAKESLKAEFRREYPNGSNAQWQAFVNANA